MNGEDNYKGACVRMRQRRTKYFKGKRFIVIKNSGNESPPTGVYKNTIREERLACIILLRDGKGRSCKYYIMFIYKFISC